MNTAAVLLKRSTTVALLTLWLLVTPAISILKKTPAVVHTCHTLPPHFHPGDGGGQGKKGGECKECVVEELRYACPKCTPILRCLARCMWGGGGETKCIQKCDCGGGKPTLSDCKACMSRCKCSCM